MANRSTLHFSWSEPTPASTWPKWSWFHYRPQIRRKFFAAPTAFKPLTEFPNCLIFRHPERGFESFSHGLVLRRKPSRLPAFGRLGKLESIVQATGLPHPKLNICGFNQIAPPIFGARHSFAFKFAGEHFNFFF